MQLGVLYTGGTIGSVNTPLRPLSSAEFQAAFEKLITPVLKSQFADLEVGYITFGTGTLDSTNLQPSDWCKMASDILGAYGAYDGFLILHGTDTMAFTASALSFLLTAVDDQGNPTAVLNKPVVVTGSQIPLFFQNTDSDPLNFRFDTDAFQNVCGAVAAAHTGVPEVCLFFENLLLRGNRTLKTNASQFDAFSSPNYPPLGKAGIEFELDNATVLPPPVTSAVSLNNVEPWKLAMAQLAHITKTIDSVKAMQFPAFPAPYTVKNGDAPASSFLATLLTAVLGPNCDGLNALVLESYGEGNFPSGDPTNAEDGAIYQVLDKANSADVIIMDNTQVLAGVVNSNAYQSGSWLAGIGVVGAFDMTPIASYCKLLYLLSLSDLWSWESGDVKRLMQTNLSGEIIDIARLDSRNGRFLAPGEAIQALDGTVTLVNESSTGPVLITNTGECLWQMVSAGAAGLPGRLYMETDGTLQLVGESNESLYSVAPNAAGPAMLKIEGSTTPGGFKVFTYNYALNQITNMFYPPS